MVFRTKLTTEEKEQILQWARESVRTTEIVKRLEGKVTKQRIDQILKQHDLNPAKVLREKRVKDWATKMSAKWGENHLDPLTRNDAVYQQMREKFRQKKANNFKHEWTIDFGELEFPSHCPLLGIELDYFAQRSQENSVSFDRIDSSKGYVKGNVIICSWRANRIKNDGTAEEHKKIYEFLSKFVDNS
jgi:hypothetical protein